MVRIPLGIALGVVLPLLPTLSLADLTLAQQKNCMSCHAVSNKVVGPSFESIAEKYGKQNASSKLASKIMRGSSRNWGAISMPPNPQLTPDEAQALVKWIMSLR
ncbi:c-type cytochrome [Candidatus Symbiobacter mobilis]|uniref:Cytochrome c551/c552 n=1 Tax=Candidatus Symbiobacter mobilis CR TaxID=946483 RepID=U5N8G4_9BURK|nr:c-type cytochrome [Candidatus Symbiobacter mobilis]AGX86464.1 cytochrome c551/c552 [Candidatus Symbiobacter mobilis CR]